MASPTAWDTDNKPIYLDSDGLMVNYIGSCEDAATILANYPILPQSGFFYFEVNIIDRGNNGIIGIGFCAKTVDLNKMPGWEDDSWGYHGDDGGCFYSSGSGRSYGPTFTTGDTVGCCLNFLHNTAFYTKNGVHLGIAFRWLEGDLYPCVGMRSPNGLVEVNFGHKKFKYEAMNSDDIDDEFLKEKWNESIFKLTNQKIDRFAELTRSFEITLNHDILLRYRVKVHFIMGKFGKALEDLTKLLEIKPNDEFALKYQGEIHYIAEDYEESLKDLNKLLGVDPNNEWALKALEVVNWKITMEKEEELDSYLDRQRRISKKLEEDIRNMGNFISIEDDLRRMQELRIDAERRLRIVRDCGWRNICIKRLEKEFSTWTSGDKLIDDFIRKKQLKASFLTDVIEWIPFDRFKNLKYLAKGGFGTVYTAIWADGYITCWDSSNSKWKRCDGNEIYCLKSLDNSTKNVKKILQEIENQFKLREDRGIPIYGITKDSDNYMVVMQYAKEGSLRKMLDKDYNHLSWAAKIRILTAIAWCLAIAHNSGIVHTNLHAGNIVMQSGYDSYVTDFGSLTSQHESEIFGVLPYVAPEVLKKKIYTESSDIYSFGIVMYEVLTGYPPYHDVEHGINLAKKICLGDHPEIKCPVPQLLLDLTEKCWDSDPSNRPTAKEIHKTLDEHLNSYSTNSEIYNQIKEIEKDPNCSPYGSIPPNYAINPDDYISRLLDFKNLPEPK